MPTDQGSVRKATEKFIFRYFLRIMIAFIVIIVIAVVVLLLYPKYKEISDLKNNQLKSIERELSTKMKTLDNYEDVTESFEEINQDDEEILDQLLPENIEVTSYYLKIADLIYTWHYRLDSISIQDSSKGGDGLRAGQESMGSKENLKSIAINISVSEGTYENMKTLLKQIEKTMPLMDITNFTSGAPGFGDHSITMQTYYLKNTNVNKEEKTE